MKKSCLFFDKKYKCVCFIVHYTGLTLNNKNDMLRIMQERTLQETKPTIFYYFFSMKFCNRMFTLPTHLSPCTL